MAIQSFGPLQRIAGLQSRMRGAGVEALLLNYSKSLFYYTGTTQPSFLIVSPGDYRLLVLRGIEHVSGESWLPADKIESSRRGLDDAAGILEKWGIGSGVLGMELDVIPANVYLKTAAAFQRFEIADISGVILDQRKIKDQGEVEKIREACRILHEGHKRILQVLCEGMTELQLSSEIEDAHRRAGHEGQYFIRQFDFYMGRGPVASGENLSRIAGKVQSITGVGLSPAIPLGASRRELKRGDMIVVDIPTIYHGYHSDQSRTYAVGRAPDACRDLYRGLREIADRILARLRPGKSCDEVYAWALSFADELGFSPYFMRLGGSAEKLAFVGHGLGLEVNEPPLIGKHTKEVLQEGMVVTLEMEMWKSDHEVVKLEDTLLLREEGVEILTVTPRELHEV